MIWIIGSGAMAVEYAKVLNALELEYQCIGRGKASCDKFEAETGHTVIAGGIDAFLSSTTQTATYAIVAVSVEELAKVGSLLVEYGIKKILLEKPAGLTINDIDTLNSKAIDAKCDVFVAYNRRFYESVNQAKRLIKEDGGVTSLTYEITEWAHVVKDAHCSVEAKQNWFLANTTHVIDLAFYLGGKPVQMQSYNSGKLDWHPSSSNFAGAGITEVGALFSYQGNWNSPGRWSLDVMTKKHRYIFRPMESLQIQDIGSVSTEFVDLTDELDQNFKPGLFLQTEAFLSDKPNGLCSLSEHIRHFELYQKMAGYKLD
ncbi:gfo/Idh/MocA family oxidoreductase [Catenovulum sp. SM1970]|uniref:gfo/Idh/MocA family oxidoreductase n=1 Tax=Marinifaba aquimaris TaxID=2741323 RepID=UPI0015743FA2|nr:gfo/Idh/MocA family oxidoreductase [Marinifaba aquimaris]NTS75355.1 gfo/Idh/MocA family oxidoreductase [Marinifaba aquimaris]